MQDKQYYQHKISALISDEKKTTASSEAKKNYAQQHSARFEKLINLVDNRLQHQKSNILDIGRSELTYMLSKKYPNVTSLGYAPADDDGGHRELNAARYIPHITFDLNRADCTNLWPEENAGSFDLILFSETIEHLHVAPEFVLLFLRYLLKDEGQIVVTTPNAASIYSRTRLLFGVHPYEKIRFYKQNPGHFREYTVREMEQIGKTAGLCTDDIQLVNYQSINYFYSSANLKYLLLKPFEFIPNLRRFMIVVFKPHQ